MSTVVDRAFTVVELLVIIVVIGILATISVVTYSGSVDRSEYARAQSDMKHINDAISIYKSQKGAYPSAGTDSFTAVPTSLATLVSENFLDSEKMLTAKDGYSYIYRTDADGSEYKLLRTITTGTLKSVETSGNPLLNTSGTSANNSWGYWSAGAVSW